MSYEINPVNSFCTGEFNTKNATLKQNASATADVKAGTLLYVDDDGKMNVFTDEVSTASPIAVLLNDVTETAIKADDVVATVIYGAKVSKKALEAVNTDVTITDALVWESYKNGLDIIDEQ